MRFVGFFGEVGLSSLPTENTLYVLDANIALQLLRHESGKQTLGKSAIEFLRVTRPAVSRAWCRSSAPTINIDPTLALIELTRQFQKPDALRFQKEFDRILTGVYGVEGHDAIWTLSSLVSAVRATASTHPSIAATLAKAYSIATRKDRLTGKQVLTACEQLLGWVLDNHQELAMIGGPLLYVIVYALAGSPDAQAIVKLSQASKGNPKKVADNVAWDFIYWLRMEMEYHRAQWSNCIVCTADRHLADFLARRVHQGPRSDLTSESPAQFVKSYGEIAPFKLRRMENTRLEREVFQLVATFYTELGRVESESFVFAPI